MLNDDVVVIPLLIYEVHTRYGGRFIWSERGGRFRGRVGGRGGGGGRGFRRKQQLFGHGCVQVIVRNPAALRIHL